MKKFSIESNFHSPVMLSFKNAYKSLFDPSYADPAFIWDSVKKHKIMKSYCNKTTENPKPAQKIILKVMVCGHNEET